jgi:HPt (histidine-containing phosphotransfer) domain-containing protein
MPSGGIDFTSLLHRCMGNHDLAHRVVQKFLIQAEADTKEIQTAIQGQDSSKLRLVAHRLKGSAANVSAESVRGIASRLEVLGQECKLAQAAELHGQLSLSLAAVKVPDLPTPSQIST